MTLISGKRRQTRAATRTAQLLVRLGSALAVAGTAHTVINLRLMRRPDLSASPPAETVSVLLPLRNEADRVAPCLKALLLAAETARTAGMATEIVVLDDGSTDGTSDVVRAAAAASGPTGAPVRLVTGTPLPDGWLGKPWACHQLADLADAGSDVLVFLDADVVLAPQALVAAVAMLRRDGLDLVSPYPRQRAESLPERLVQPLLQWSWLTTLPLRLAESSPRPSTAAANGQLLVVDRATYDEAGGHGAVRDEVLDDMALMRAVKAAGGRGGMADGTALATCRMYDGWGQVRAGYTKSLWSAFGSPRGAAGALSMLGLAYVVPAAAALVGSPVGAAGYSAGVAGRALVARRVGGRVWPDAAAHPLSVLALSWLTVQSFVGRRRGRLTWRGRTVG